MNPIIFCVKNTDNWKQRNAVFLPQSELLFTLHVNSKEIFFF